MTVRKPMVAGNWKMNGSLGLVSDLTQGLSQASLDGVEVALFPPFPLLTSMVETGVNTGAQTVSENDAGAFTGEVEGKLLAELGIKYALVGHSERRSLFGESNQIVAAKFAKAQEAGLIPVLCIGETESERNEGKTESVIAAQLDAVIEKLGVASLKCSVIAYEPVWAIGTGKTASPEQAQEVHQFIRSKIASLDNELAQSLTLLYGGSVNETNSALLFAQPDIDGGLIGGASLKTQSFVAICESAKGNV